MKKLTKILAIVLTIALLVTLAACGGGGAGSPANQGTANSESTEPPPDEADPSEGNETENGESETTMPEEIVPLTVTEGVLTMVTNADFPPYEFYQGDDIVGIDPEIAAAIAEKLGLELRIMDIDFDSVIISVETGMFDMAMAGLTVTDERLEQINFTISYATGVQVIIVPEDSPITSVDDLFAEGAFHTIGVQLSTTGDLYSTWDLADEGLAEIERFTRGTDAVMALNAGRVDAVIIDNEPAKFFVEMNTGLKILETEFAVENYAIGINLSNTVLLEKINEALRELIADGTVQAILDKYITSD